MQHRVSKTFKGLGHDQMCTAQGYHKVAYKHDSQWPTAPPKD
ncbi:BZIP domain-containing protein [Psidium guajava]|nr:BZIP domain-containing protein [Psidium guajava]